MERILASATSLLAGVVALVGREAGAEVVRAAPVSVATPADADRVDHHRYALWELVPLGLDTGTADAMKEMLRGELRKIVGQRLVMVAEAVDDRLRERIDACDERIACLAEAGGAVGATRVILGVVTNLGDHYNMSLRLVEAPSGRLVSRESETLSGERDQLLGAIEVLLFRLIAPDRLRGEAEVDVNVAGAEIIIDGRSIGKAPLAGPVALGQGQHTLKVSAPAIEDYFTFFEILHGKTTRITVEAKRLEALAAELEVVTRPLKPVLVGVKGGYTTNFSRLGQPTVAVELGAGVRALSRYLHVGVELGYGRLTRRDETNLGEALTTEVWQVPLVAWAGVELPVDPLAFYLRGGAGGALVHREARAPSAGTTRVRTVEPLFAGSAGAAIRLGPGRLLVELAYQHTLAAEAAVRGSAGGLRAVAGYRLEL